MPVYNRSADGCRIIIKHIVRRENDILAVKIDVFFPIPRINQNRITNVGIIDSRLNAHISAILTAHFNNSSLKQGNEGYENDLDVFHFFKGSRIPGDTRFCVLFHQDNFMIDNRMIRSYLVKIHSAGNPGPIFLRAIPTKCMQTGLEFTGNQSV